MAATYKNISAQEMRDFLRIERGWSESVFQGKIKELVFEKVLAEPTVKLKVYTGILADSGFSRPVGGDAIRVCAIRTLNNQTFGFVKSKRVHRVHNWQENLKKRIFEVIEESNKRLNKPF